MAYLAHGRPIPDPRKPRGGEEAIIFDPVTAARAALATAMRTKRISNVPLAKTLGKSEGAIRRLTDGSSATLNSKHSGAGRAGFATSPDRCATMA